MDYILGIESSCDETAASVVCNGDKVLSNIIATQISKHAPYGGVVPELAAREHLKNIQTVVDEALQKASLKINEIAAIAVTNGPGLLPALLVGVNFAKSLAHSRNKPLIGINHFQAHIYGSFLQDGISKLSKAETYPIVALVVSGGHTAIVVIESNGQSRIVGSTLDDAAGEAFDKAAKLLNLGYPGGPLIEESAKNGNSKAVKFPRPMTGNTGKPLAKEHRFDFSFSGLKTSLLYHCRKNGLIDSDRNMTGNISVKDMPNQQILYDTIASYQEAIIDVLSTKLLDAVEVFKAKTAVVCGGVACNGTLRSRIIETLPKSVDIKIAPPCYCTDNAAMIAGLAWSYYNKNQFNTNELDAYTRLPSSIMKLPYEAK